MYRQRNGQNGQQRGLHRGIPNRNEPKTHAGDSDLKIMSAKDKNMHAVNTLRIFSRLERNMKAFPLTISALRSEAINMPTEPEPPALNVSAAERTKQMKITTLSFRPSMYGYTSRGSKGY